MTAAVRTLAEVQTEIAETRREHDRLAAAAAALLEQIGPVREEYVVASASGNGSAARAKVLERDLIRLEAELGAAGRVRDVAARRLADLAEGITVVERLDREARKAALRERFTPKRARYIAALAELRRAALEEERFEAEVTRAGFDAITDVMGQRPFVASAFHDLERALFAGSVDTLDLRGGDVFDPHAPDAAAWWADDRVVERLRKLAAGGKR